MILTRGGLIVLTKSVVSLVCEWCSGLLTLQLLLPLVSACDGHRGYLVGSIIRGWACEQDGLTSLFRRHRCCDGVRGEALKCQPHNWTVLVHSVVSSG
jgi:hypothetical protein